MKKKISKSLLVLTFISIIILISSCKKSSNGEVVARVDGKPITSRDFKKELQFYQSYYTKIFGEDFLTKDKKNQTNNEVKLKEDLIDSMIKDKIMVNDLLSKNVEIDENLPVDLKNKLIDSLHGEDSLKANIRSLNVSESLFDEVLYNDSIREAHYNYFLTHNDIKDKEILKFYEANEELHRMFKYNALVFDSEIYAKHAKEKISDGNDFKKVLNDPVRNFSILNSDFVYINDPLLKKAKVDEKEIVSEIIQYEDKYVILMINSYNDNRNELLIRAKDIYLKNAYKKYLDELIKESKIEVFV
ncbi:MAG: SurA N-terminal domain-containing protein [Tissierellia bacterium]|nr:SurA N-terminal domain-containing protein [Tissierellia bacterium]